MNNSRTHRIFYAITPSEKALQRIAEITKQLQIIYTSTSIRWTQPQNLHITLQFLGAVHFEDVEKISMQVRAEIAEMQSFDLQLQELELFPTSHPHIISMHMNQHERLSLLATNIGKGIITAGYEIEKRPFREHLTLARLNKDVKNFVLEKIALPKIEPFRVKEIVLFESKPNQTGSNYTVLDRIKLKT